MPKNKDTPKEEEHVSILDGRVTKGLTVGAESGKLFWHDKEIVARKVIDLHNIKTWWTVIAAIVAVLAGLSALLSAFVDLNKETCWVHIGACKAPPPNNPPVPTGTPPSQVAPAPIILSGVYFDTDSAVLKLESETAINDLVHLLHDEPKLHIEIHGHTDNTGSASHNLKLSSDRAASVVQWLIEHRGIAAERLTSKGYGSTKPVADNATAEGRAKNRRVEFAKI